MIKQYVDQDLQDTMFEHTRMLKEGTEYEMSPDQSESDETESIDIDEFVHSFEELFPVDQQSFPVDSTLMKPHATSLDVPRSPGSDAESGHGNSSTVSNEDTKYPPSRSHQSRLESDAQVKAMKAETREKPIEEARAKPIEEARTKPIEEARA